MTKHAACELHRLFRIERRSLARPHCLGAHPNPQSRPHRCARLCVRQAERCESGPPGLRPFLCLLRPCARHASARGFAAAHPSGKARMRPGAARRSAAGGPGARTAPTLLSPARRRPRALPLRGGSRDFRALSAARGRNITGRVRAHGTSPSSPYLSFLLSSSPTSLKSAASFGRNQDGVGRSQAKARRIRSTPRCSIAAHIWSIYENKSPNIDKSHSRFSFPWHVLPSVRPGNKLLRANCFSFPFPDWKIMTLCSQALIRGPRRLSPGAASAPLECCAGRPRAAPAARVGNCIGNAVVPH